MALPPGKWCSQKHSLFTCWLANGGEGIFLLEWHLSSDANHCSENCSWPNSRSGIHTKPNGACQCTCFWTVVVSEVLYLELCAQFVYFTTMHIWHPGLWNSAGNLVSHWVLFVKFSGHDWSYINGLCFIAGQNILACQNLAVWHVVNVICLISLINTS